MADQTVTLVLDAAQYHREIAKITSSTQGLSGAGERMGEGFIRGDRAVRRATQGITQGLISVNNAADATLLTFGALERVFKIPLAGTIGAAAGIAGTAALRAEFKKTQDAVDALRQNLRVPISIEIGLSPEDIATRVDSLRKTVADLEKRSVNFGEKVARFFAPAASGGMASGATREAEQTKLIAEGERAILELENARANKVLQIAGLKLVAGDLDKAALIFEQQRSALLEESVTKGGNTLNIYKRLLAAQIDVEVAARKKAESDKKTLDAAKATTAELQKQVGLIKEKTRGEAASERRQARSENRREKQLKDELSREGDPEKRADIKDELEEIAQARRDRAEKQRQQERARQEAQRLANEARAKQEAIEAQQREEKRASDQKKSDQSEVQRFGRVLTPQERQQVGFEDSEAARQKAFQDDENARVQAEKDQREARARGISDEQLKNEREFNKSRGKDVSSVDDLANKDFSGIASLANQDFSGIASLGGLSISIA